METGLLPGLPFAPLPAPRQPLVLGDANERNPWVAATSAPMLQEGEEEQGGLEQAIVQAMPLRVAELPELSPGQPTVGDYKKIARLGFLPLPLSVADLLHQEGALSAGEHAVLDTVQGESASSSFLATSAGSGAAGLAEADQQAEAAAAAAGEVELDVAAQDVADMFRAWEDGPSMDSVITPKRGAPPPT